MVVVRLAERSLPTPDIRGSNPVIGNFIYYQLYQLSRIDKTKIKKKRLGMAHLFKKFNSIGLLSTHLAIWAVYSAAESNLFDNWSTTLPNRLWPKRRSMKHYYELGCRKWFEVLFGREFSQHPRFRFFHFKIWRLDLVLAKNVSVICYPRRHRGLCIKMKKCCRELIGSCQKRVWVHP